MSLVKILAVVVALGVAGYAMAADEAKPKGLHGKVVKVEGTNVVIKTKTPDGPKEVTVPTTDQTVVTIDGKDGKVADLKEGMRVTVTPPDGVATKIVAKTPILKAPAAPKPAK